MDSWKRPSGFEVRKSSPVLTWNNKLTRSSPLLVFFKRVIQFVGKFVANLLIRHADPDEGIECYDKPGKPPQEVLDWQHPFRYLVCRWAWSGLHAGCCHRWVDWNFNWNCEPVSKWEESFRTCSPMTYVLIFHQMYMQTSLLVVLITYSQVIAWQSLLEVLESHQLRTNTPWIEERMSFIPLLSRWNWSRNQILLNIENASWGAAAHDNHIRIRQSHTTYSA